ncbi:hypothetical protein KI387_037421, partial [Taxus chinensis]
KSSSSYPAHVDGCPHLFQYQLSVDIMRHLDGYAWNMVRGLAFCVFKAYATKKISLVYILYNSYRKENMEHPPKNKGIGSSDHFQEPSKRSIQTQKSPLQFPISTMASAKSLAAHIAIYLLAALGSQAAGPAAAPAAPIAAAPAPA